MPETPHAAPARPLGRDHPVLRFAKSNDVQLYLFRENRGLARSWNEVIHQSTQNGCEINVVLNDELHFIQVRFYAFAPYLRADLKWPLGFIKDLEIRKPYVDKVINQGVAFFAINERFIDMIGYFDETFAPVYYVDINYLRRMRLAGCRKLIAPGAPGEHLRMATIGSNPEIRESMNDWNGKNEAYYVRKWGPH